MLAITITHTVKHNQPIVLVEAALPKRHDSYKHNLPTAAELHCKKQRLPRNLLQMGSW